MNLTATYLRGRNNRPDEHENKRKRKASQGGRESKRREEKRPCGLLHTERGENNPVNYTGKTFLNGERLKKRSGKEDVARDRTNH